MNLIALDVGSYSIKFYEVKSERRGFALVEKKEILIDEYRESMGDETPLIEIQKEIIAYFLQGKAHDVKIIFQLPNDFITTRYLNIPVNSRRKAEQIIPFQLDENLPYSMNQAHFTSRLNKIGETFQSMTCITQLNNFRDFYHSLESKETLPSILTSEISIIQSYVDYIRMNEVACILDLGHTNSKAYFVQNRQIVANHSSYVAGHMINQVISQTYQIPYIDSAIYKHEHCFMLTDEHLNEYDQDQRDFAELMRNIFMPLVQDIKRWEIGHRVKFGTQIEKIYIMGGTSNIRYLHHYLTAATGIQVELLPPIAEVRNDSDYDTHFMINKMIIASQKSKQTLMNFLIGKFQTHSHTNVSLHSSVFLSYRSLMVAIILIATLYAEKFIYLNPKEKKIDSKISTMLKNSNISISKSESKGFKTNPEKLLSTLKRKNKSITQEVSTVLSSSKVDALKPLAKLSGILANNPNIDLLEFRSEYGIVEAKFYAEVPTEFDPIMDQINKAGLPESQINYVTGQNILTLNFRDY